MSTYAPVVHRGRGAPALPQQKDPDSTSQVFFVWKDWLGDEPATGYQAILEDGLTLISRSHWAEIDLWITPTEQQKFYEVEQIIYEGGVSGNSYRITSRCATATLSEDRSCVVNVAEQ